MKKNKKNKIKAKKNKTKSIIHNSDIIRVAKV